MLIDFHTHAFAPKIAARAIEQLTVTCETRPLTDGTVEDTLRRMDEWGVDRAVLLPIATKPTQHTVINTWAKETDGGRFISFGSVYPKSEEAPEVLENIKALGLHGVKLHPDYQDCFVNERCLDPFYDELERLGLPVVFHAGLDPVSPDCIHCDPEAAADMLSRHRKLRAVFAHLGGNEQWQRSLDHLCGAPGEVYLDTAYSLYCPDELMLKIIRKHGAERVLFASDCPWAPADRTLEKLMRIGLTDSELDLITHRNAERLLGL